MKTAWLIVCFWGMMLGENAFTQKLNRRAFLGIETENKDNKLFISRVFPQTAAEKAGLQVGDEVLTIDGIKPANQIDLAKIIRSKNPREEISLVVRRKQQILTFKPVLEETPQENSTSYFRVLYDEFPTQDAVLRTIITSPTKVGRHPAVLFVQGVACFPIDTPFDTTYGHVQIARQLSRQNIVTMRVEKSGVGDSQGIDCEKMDLHTEIKHFSDAVRVLQSYPFVDKDNIFIIGHSLGGVIAPIIAKREKAKGVIVFGTIGQNWVNYLIDSRRNIALQKGEDWEDVEDWTKTVTDCSVRFFIQKQSADSIFKQNPDCKDFLHKFAIRNPAYWHQLAELNIAQIWKDYDGFVLSMWGEHDRASLEKEHQLITDIVNKHHPRKATFLKISRTDHRMALHNGNCKEKDFNPQIAENIYEWIQKVKAGVE
ncbi:MAG: site-2 protease family protein [Raineya sp.]|nr:PDZ domain-containing protein [Raineya sp.]MDW8296258.1 site-2 protease family protein [Raineya sp.]